MDFEKLKLDIKEAAKNCFSFVRSKHKEKLSGYALYSDSGAMTVGASVNSHKNLKEMCDDDPGDATYYKWSPGEWDYESECVDFFSSISKRLTASVNNMSDSQFSDFRMQLYEICVQALEGLVCDGFFDEECVVVFTISDDEIPEKEIEWMKRLNSSKNSLEFEQWVDSL